METTEIDTARWHIHQHLPVITFVISDVFRADVKGRSFFCFFLNQIIPEWPWLCDFIKKKGKDEARLLVSFQLCSIYGAAVWYTNRQRSCESGIKPPRPPPPPIFSRHPTFPLWPLREQEPLSELFIQSASPGGLDKTAASSPVCPPKPPRAPLRLSGKNCRV